MTPLTCHLPWSCSQLDSELAYAKSFNLTFNPLIFADLAFYANRLTVLARIPKKFSGNSGTLGHACIFQDNPANSVTAGKDM